jgi:hypothetical protein
MAPNHFWVGTGKYMENHLNSGRAMWTGGRMLIKLVVLLVGFENAM